MRDLQARAYMEEQASLLLSDDEIMKDSGFVVEEAEVESEVS